MERERLQDYVGNGVPVQPTFSAAEMQRRLDAIRAAMADLGIDAALFTSYHNINYYADFLYCYFGRRYGLVVTQDASTSISAGIELISLAVELSCMRSPLRSSAMPIASCGPASSGVTSAGPQGADPSKALPGIHWGVLNW